MTSAEFAAKYRVLKTLTERGARTQIAQEVALGRMVMIHHLDVGTSADCGRLAAKVGQLSAEAMSKVFDVVTIDGTQVIVTHFLATFIDLPSWLEQNAASPDPLDAKTVVMEAPSVPTPAAPPPTRAPLVPPISRTAAPPAAGFTAVFGASTPQPNAPPAATRPVAPLPPVTPLPAAPPEKKGSFTEVFAGMTPAAAPLPPPPTVAPPRPIPPPIAPPTFSPPPPAPLPPAAQQAPESSFTSVFGAKPARGVDPTPSAFRSTPPTPSALPMGPNAARFDSVMPPVEAPPPRPAPPPPQAPAVNPSSNDFNALFARLEPSAPASSPPPMYAAPSTPAPSGSAPPAPSWQPPPPLAPPTPGVSSLAPRMPGATPSAAGPSEFTRVLGRMPAPPAGPPPARLPDANTSAPSYPTPAIAQPQAAPAAASKPAKSYLPLIIALNVVLIGAILVVVFFVMKH